MTAHVLVPSLDEEKPATLSRRIVYDLLRDELGFEGVILSDDLEMKAIAATYRCRMRRCRRLPPAATACCDLRRPTSTCRWQALEALVHAVEDGRIPYKRLEDALTRQRRAKERFLAARVPPARRPKPRVHVVGCDAHRRIADEMAR